MGSFNWVRVKQRALIVVRCRFFGKKPSRELDFVTASCRDFVCIVRALVYIRLSRTEIHVSFRARVNNKIVFFALCNVRVYKNQCLVLSFVVYSAM